ncbi:MAG TPA: serpin family protein, partial [Candidatus Thermoplasmatota archaeon]|nr:serpin family protein [Candidatus Thermoplasmatota archaeon]
GTVAAAVTTIAFAESGVIVPETIVVDRPFLFVIRDDASGSVLFLGKVMDPAAG